MSSKKRANKGSNMNFNLPVSGRRCPAPHIHSGYGAAGNAPRLYPVTMGATARRCYLFTLQAVWRVSVPASTARRYGGSRPGVNGNPAIVTAQCQRYTGMCTRRGNREQGTGTAAAARSDESIGTESATAAFPVPSASVLRIPLYQRTLSCNPNISRVRRCSGGLKAATVAAP